MEAATRLPLSAGRLTLRGSLPGQAVAQPAPRPLASSPGSGARWCPSAIQLRGSALLVAAGLGWGRSRRQSQHASCRTRMLGTEKIIYTKLEPPKPQTFKNLTAAELDPDGTWEPWSLEPLQTYKEKEIKDQNIHNANAMMKRWWKRQPGRKFKQPGQLKFGPAPDNPWRDRYLLCKDCERRRDFEGLPPRKGCNCSTLLELDMTAPFSRSNVMATSCQVVQKIRDDVWVRSLGDGHFLAVKNKAKSAQAAAFPVQVCAVCKKTSLDEGRRFQMCERCHGVSYCSDECRAKHAFIHKASCTRPLLPHREEWGIRSELRKMREEIYPITHKWKVRDVERHRIAWLPPAEGPKRTLQGADVRHVRLPGFSPKRTYKLPRPVNRTTVEDGKLSIVAQPRTFTLQRSPRVRAAEPDDYQLMTIGMTREEFRHRESRLLAERAEDRRAEAAQGALAAIAEAGALEEERRLSEGAVERIETAAAGAQMVRPKELPKAPWELLEEEEAAKAGGRRELTKKNLLPDDMPSPDNKKDGVVYKRTLVREESARRGLKLSEEALRNLEEAAAASKKWQNKPKELDPRWDKSVF